MGRRTTTKRGLAEVGLGGLLTPSPSVASPSVASISSMSECESPVRSTRSKRSSKAKRAAPADAAPVRRSKRIKAQVPDTRCHVDILPTELLIMIFQEVQKSLKTQKYTLEPSVKTVCGIAHVCQRWRNIMIHSPPHMSLYSVFDDRKDASELEVPEIHRSTIKNPDALADFLEEYKVRELASFVFAGQSDKVFDFDLMQRNKRRRKLVVKRLWFLGLNHLSAELLLTNEFKNLQYLSFMYTQVNHISQICHTVRRPIVCEILSLDGVAVRSSSVDPRYWEDGNRDMCVLNALDHIRLWIHFSHLRVNATSLLGGATPTSYARSREICKSEHKDHVREFQTVSNTPPALETLGIWEFTGLQLREMNLDISQLKQISVEISEFNYGQQAKVWTKNRTQRWEDDFWCTLLKAGKKLEKVAISGLKKEKDLLDLGKALGRLSPECKVSFSKSIPDEVIEALKRQRPQVEFVSNSPPPNTVESSSESKGTSSRARRSRDT